jgi:hypothetical protein
VAIELVLRTAKGDRFETHARCPNQWLNSAMNSFDLVGVKVSARDERLVRDHRKHKARVPHHSQPVERTPRTLDGVWVLQVDTLDQDRGIAVEQREGRGAATSGIMPPLN